MKKLAIVVALGLVPFLFPSDAFAAWTYLGERAVSHQAEKDTIHVGHQGMFKGLEFRVKHNDIRLFRFQVVFGNGEVQALTFGRVIRAGQSSGYIDLPGRKRLIKRIEFWYKTVGRAGPQARVAVWGRQ
jgi:hypothetical protein